MEGMTCSPVLSTAKSYVRFQCGHAVVFVVVVFVVVVFVVVVFVFLVHIINNNYHKYTTAIRCLF